MTDPVVIPDDQEQFKLNEVCKLANVQPYMLRFWGTEFPQLEAAKSGTGQRLYTRDQVETILEIRRLLFDEGLTIAGARKKLESGGGAPRSKAPVKEAKQPEVQEPSELEPPVEETSKPEPTADKQPKKAASPAKKTTTSSARRSVKKKESKSPAASGAVAAEEVDKEAAADVQPLLATLKSVRDEIDTIVTELKGK